MADHDLSDVLNFFRPLSEWDKSLIGFEPSTQPVDPSLAEDVRSLQQIVAECAAAGTPHKIVVDAGGFLCVWRKASDFWD